MSPTFRQGSEDVGSPKPTTSYFSCDGGRNTILYFTNTDEVICMNIVKHIARLLKSDAFLAVVYGVWAACDSFGYGVYAAGGDE